MNPNWLLLIPIGWIALVVIVFLIRSRMLVFGGWWVFFAGIMLLCLHLWVFGAIVGIIGLAIMHAEGARQ